MRTTVTDSTDQPTPTGAVDWVPDGKRIDIHMETSVESLAIDIADLRAELDRMREGIRAAGRMLLAVAGEGDDE